MIRFACLVLAASLALPLFGAADSGDPVAWARANVDAGRYKEAAEMLRKSLAENPQSPDRTAWSLELARVLRITGGYDEALKLCDEVLKAGGDLKDVVCLQGELLADVGRYEEALKAFDALIKADEKNERAWAMRKQVARTLGRAEIVKASTDHFFALFNDNADAFQNGTIEDAMMPAYVGIGIQDENPKDAFEVGFMLAENFIKKRGLKAAEVFVWSGQLSLEKYAFAFAAQRFQQALQLRPKWPDALTGMAQVLIAMPQKAEDLKKAEEILKQALEVNPNHVEAHLTLSAMAVRDDDTTSSKEHLDAALRINPNHLEGLSLLAFYYHDLGDSQKEAEIEKRVFSINPKYAEYYCTMGELLESKRGFAEAPEYYKKAIALDPEYWRGYYGLGMSTSRQGAHGEEDGKKLLLKAFSMNKFNLWASNMIKALDKVIGDKEQNVDPQYAESKTKNFTLKFHAKDAEIIRPYLEEWAEKAHERQAKMFNFEPQGPLSVEVCFSFSDQAARTVGVPNLGALGVCFGKLCTLVSPREGKGGNHPPFNWRRVLEHEFGHVMTLQMSQFKIPRWYTEGMSTYLEGDTRLNMDQMMIDALAYGQLKPIEKMNEYFKGNILMAYVHGAYFVEFLIKNFGWDAHLKALKMFSEGKKAEEVFPAVTGKTLEELNAGQLAHVVEVLSKVRLRPSMNQAEYLKLEALANKPDAPAKDIARLAEAQWTSKEHRGATLATLEKALAKDPNCAQALALQGRLAYAKKDFLGAKASFEKATKVDPEASFSAWHLLGIILKKEGRTSEAIAALEKAHEMYPRYVGEDNPLLLLSELQLDLEPPQEAKAMELCKEAIAIYTSDPEPAKRGLKSAMKLKDWKSATEFAEALFEIDPYDLESHRKAGRVYEELKDWAKAAREYHVATTLDEKDVESFASLARVELARGDKDAARKAVKAALEIDATHEGAKALRREIGG
jgi:tetratricopeptide (TPR) repeat protein